MAQHGRGIEQIPFGGEAIGPNPTDRAKGGTKRSVLTEAAGIPLAVVVDGANRHDTQLVEETLNSMQIQPADPKVERHLCLDKGYDSNKVRETVRGLGLTPHVRSRCEEMNERIEIPGYRARRWVVERTHSWMNRFRRLLVRWEKKKANYLAMIHLTCAYITFKAAKVFG